MLEDLEEEKRIARESQKQYQTLFENMLNGLAFHKIITNKKGRPIDYIFLETNSAFEKLTKKKKKDIIGKKVTEVFPGIENDPANWIERYGRVAKTGKGEKFEGFLKGLNKWFSVNAYSTQKGYFAAVFEDITKEKMASDALKKSEERYSKIIQVTNSLIYDYDVTTGKISWDGTIKELTGFSKKEFSKIDIKKWEDMIHPDDVRHAMLALNKSMQLKKEYHVTYRFQKKDKTYFVAEDRGSFLYDKKGKAYRMLGIMNDITARKQAEQEKEKATLEELRLKQENKLIIQKSIELAEAKKKIEDEVWRAQRKKDGIKK